MKNSMKPYILLYNPPTTLNKDFKVNSIPLNLLSICSLINTKKVSIIISDKLPNECFNKFKPFIKKSLCLGISCMTGIQIKYALIIAKRVKELNSRITVIFGGYHVSALPEQTLRNEYVDIVVKGYGEITFSELVKKLIQKQSIENIKGIIFKHNDKFIHTNERPVINLNDLPSIPYHFFNIKNFFKETNSRTLHYISSRGCPHKCGFCADYVIYKQKWNPLSSKRVIDDLIRLKKEYNFDNIRFYDSNLFVSEKRIIKICKGIIKAKLNFNWIKCNADTSILSKYSNSTLSLMKKAGVSNVLLGIESGYQPALQCINKMANNKDNLKAIKKLHSYNISIGFSFMFGFPYDLNINDIQKEHHKELESTMKLIAKLSKEYILNDYYLFFIFTPFPGVRLFERYVKLGFNVPDTFENWSNINLNEGKSSTWINFNLLKLYYECVKINWFLIHKLERYIARNIILQNFGKYFDNIICKILYNRLSVGKLNLPIILKYIHKFYPLIQKKILDIFSKKVFLPIKIKKERKNKS